MSTNAVPAVPAAEVVDARQHRVRHVYPTAGWFSAAVLSTPGLIRYYPLNDTSGTSATESAYGQTGTYTNSPALAQAGLWSPDDATNRSVAFTAASSQYVAIPTIDFSAGVHSFTLEAILKPNSAGVGMAAFGATGAAVANQSIMFGTSVGSRYRFEFYASACDSTTAVVGGTAVHFVATYDANSDASTVYVNGQAESTNAVGPYTGAATPTCRIGNYSGGAGWGYWDGTIDEFAIYARALTAAEVLAHAEAAGFASSSSSNGGLVDRSSTMVLGRPYKAKWLPAQPGPSSPDLVSGTYTHRLNDAGEFALGFPAAEASDGIPWRERFDTAGHLEFVEIYRDDNLEFVGSIQKIAVDRQQVQVSGTDAMGLLRKGYEVDRAWTAAPADVIDSYTRVPLPAVVEEFTDLTLSPWSVWTTGGAGTFTASAATADVLRLSVTGGAGRSGYVYQSLMPVNGTSAMGDSWDATMVVRSASGISTGGLQLIVSGPDKFSNPNLTLYAACTGSAPTSLQFLVVNSSGTQTNALSLVPPGTASFPMTFEIRRRGAWVAGFINGTMVGYGQVASTDSFGRVIVCLAEGAAATPVADIESVTVRSRVPFLSRSTSTWHDRYLPGDYPTGGLRGRYWSNADLQGASTTVRSSSVMAPVHTQNAERLDATVNTGSITVPATGVGDYFSVRWFGAVYLRGDLGDFQFRCTTVVGGVRVWVANTDWGDQILDDWTVAGSRTVGPYALDSTQFGDRAAWVPIVVEFRDDANAQGIVLQFYSPSGYTDPGGTAIAATTWTTIPATSLSPLGCFDQRVQGQSHFDIVQNAASSFGLSLWCEPKQLESGEFPGRLLAKGRYGRDTDLILRSEDVDQADVFMGPSSEVDATDIATSIRGGGAGIADGAGGQIAAEVFDASAASAALFDLQAYSDASDINIPALLAARIDAELALRSSPWQNISGTPRAQERLVDTFPITGVYSAMRWRPGDAVRVWIPEVGIQDGSARQVLQVTREFAPDGRTGTSVGFRQRPKSIGRSMRRYIKAALQPQRVYQRQKVVLTSNYVTATGVAASGYSGYAYATLTQGDVVLRARLRIMNTDRSLNAYINGVNCTSALNGPWASVADIDITPYATSASSTDPRLYMRLQNNGALNGNFEFGFFVEVLR